MYKVTSSRLKVDERPPLRVNLIFLGLSISAPSVLAEGGLVPVGLVVWSPLLQTRITTSKYKAVTGSIRPTVLKNSVWQG